MQANFRQEAVNEALKGEARAERMIEAFPQLREWAKAREWTKIQEWCETTNAVEDRRDFILQCLQSRPEWSLVADFFENSEANPEWREDAKYVMKLMVEIALHRRISYDTALNLIAKPAKASPKDSEGRVHLIEETPEQLVSRFEKILSVGLFNVDPESRQIQNCREYFYLTQAEMERLDCMVTNTVMVCPPKEVRKLPNGKVNAGYLHLKRSPFTKKAETTYNLPYDFVNTQNATSYRINYEIWNALLKFYPYAPEREDKDTDFTFNRKLQDAVRTHGKKAFLIKFYQLLGVEEIWILTQFDYRFRNYPIGYLINPQGTDQDKALLLTKPVALTEEGFEWLACSVANCFNCEYKGADLDKQTFEIHMEWFESFMTPLLKLDRDTFCQTLTTYGGTAESFCCFVVQALAYYDAFKAKERGEVPMCDVITHWDATASGFQFMALMAGDEKMMRLGNLVDPLRRIDLYTVLTNELQEAGIPTSYTRTRMKKGLYIPAIYGSVRCVDETFRTKEEKEIFNNVMNKYPMWRLKNTIPSWWNADTCSYTWEMPDGCQVIKHNWENEVVYIPYEGGALSLHKRVLKTREYSCELGPNITHALDGLVARELPRRMHMSDQKKLEIYTLRNSPDKWCYCEDAKESRAFMEKLLCLGKKFNFYSFRIFWEITPNNIDLIPQFLWDKYDAEMPQTDCGISEIHDSFGVHPNYTAELMQQYRYILADVSESRYIETVYDYLADNPDGTTGKIFHKNYRDIILNSKYALC